MFTKVLFFICIISTTLAIFINPKAYKTNDWYGNKHSNSWRLVQVYHHPNSYGPIEKYEHYTYPKYEFEYQVSDKKTGDHKKHSEARDGDRVHGEYSLVDPNGSVRKVQYQADDLHGFNAVVSKSYNKHGDNAYSTFEDTRYFTPSHSYSVQINHSPKHFLHFTQEKPKLHEEKNNETPVEETKTEQDLKAEVKKPEQQNTHTILVKNEPVKNIEDNKKSTVESDNMKDTNKSLKKEITEENDGQVMMPVIAMLMNKTPEDKLFTKEILTESGEKKKTAKIQSLPDPEIASSYYNSRIYYLI